MKVFKKYFSVSDFGESLKKLMIKHGLYEISTNDISAKIEIKDGQIIFNNFNFYYDHDGILCAICGTELRKRDLFKYANCAGDMICRKCNKNK